MFESVTSERDRGERAEREREQRESARERNEVERAGRAHRQFSKSAGRRVETEQRKGSKNVKRELEERRLEKKRKR